jgi:hypothetical protein
MSAKKGVMDAKSGSVRPSVCSRLGVLGVLAVQSRCRGSGRIIDEMIEKPLALK